MGKRRKDAGAPSVRAKRKAAQSAAITSMTPISGADFGQPPQNEPDRQPSSRSNPVSLDANPASDPSFQATATKEDPDCHPDVPPDDDDRKELGEQSPRYEHDTHGSDKEDIGQPWFHPQYMCPIGTQWYPANHGDIEPNCTLMNLEQWVYNHVVEKNDDIERTISANEKKAIIDALDGWCLYKDWDSLAAALPEKPRAYMPMLLARALVSKEINMTIMKNPFFYMDLGDDVSGRSDEMPPTLGLDLYHLWQKLMKVDRVTAHAWREQTVHLINKSYPHQRPKDTSVGIRSFRLRRHITKHLALKMLDKSSPLYPLLRKDVTAETKLSRFRRLRKVYRDAAENSVKLWVDELGYEFYSDIHQIGLFDEKSGLYEMEHLTCITFRHYSLDRPSPNGRRTVLLLAPLVWQVQIGIEPTPKEELDIGCEPNPVDEDGHPNVVVCRGLVVLSKHVESEQTE